MPDLNMTSNRLRRTGEDLYGRKWKRPMAEALGVTIRSIDRWLSGQHKINERTAKAVKSLAAGGEE